MTVSTLTDNQKPHLLGIEEEPIPDFDWEDFTQGLKEDQQAFFSEVTEEEKGAMIKFLSGPECSMELVTPGLAKSLLKTSPGNRKTVNSNLSKIAVDMYSDNFYPGNDALLFDIYHRLRNGHHRLIDIVEIDKPQRMLVRRRVPEKEIPVIDQGTKRSGRAALNFMDGFKEEYEGDDIERDIAIVRTILTKGWTNQKANDEMSNFGLRDILVHLKDSLNWLRNTIVGRRVKKITTVAPILAVFVQAHKWGEDPNKLKYALDYLIEAGQSVTNGDIPRLPGTDSLLHLREWLITTDIGGSRSGRIKIWYTVMTMLNSFFRGEERQRISSKSINHWPVDLSAVLPKEPPYKIQSRSIGMDFYERLCQWLKKQTIFGGDGVILRSMVKEIMPNDTTKVRQKTLNRLRRVIKSDGYLEILGMGRLVGDDNFHKRAAKVIFEEA